MKQRIGNAVLAVFTAVMLAACGSSADSVEYATETEEAYDTAAYNSVAAYGEYAAEEPMAAEDMGFDATSGSANVEAESGAAEVQTQQTDRKLIKTVNMNVETEQFDVLMPSLESQVTALGGYIESISVDSRNNYYTDDYYGTKYLRYGNLTVRIPKQNLDAFLTTVNEQSNVTSKSEYVEDVTLQYVDLESHKKALTTEQSRLLELLGQAETVEDIITIEGRLSEVRYQIESMESQLRTYDNKIDYSTVNLSVNEVERYTPSDENTIGERIKSGFLKSLDGVGRGLLNCGIWFVVHIPYLAVWAVIIVVLLLMIRYFVTRRAKKRLKKQLKKQEIDEKKGEEGEK